MSKRWRKQDKSKSSDAESSSKQTSQTNRTQQPTNTQATQPQPTHAQASRGRAAQTPASQHSTASQRRAPRNQKSQQRERAHRDPWQGYVRISEGQMVLDGQPFRCVGANCYYLMTHAADPAMRSSISALLDELTLGGLQVVRTWAFNDGPAWNALQTAPGVYDEKVFAGLDWVVAQCKSRGLRLLLSLSNYWPDYGGLRQYVRWSKNKLDPSYCPLTESFYEDEKAQGMLTKHVETVLARVNTVTGIPYNQDSTIMGWELINEPRCDVQSGVDPDDMHQWLNQAVAHLKALSPYQLVTVGCEGFFGPSTPEHATRNPITGHGCDWGLECYAAGVDFVSLHLYPDHWLPAGTSPEQTVAFTREWLINHAALARDVLHKPIVLTEFAARRHVFATQAPPNPESISIREHAVAFLQLPPEEAILPRSQYAAHVLDACFGRGGSYCGALWWMVAWHDYDDYDGFTIYPPTKRKEGSGSDGGAGSSQLSEKEQEGKGAIVQDPTWEVLTAWARSLGPV